MSRARITPAQAYIAKTFGHESPQHIAIREALARDGKEGINVGVAEGTLLQFLVKVVKAKTVVEVGTLYGYSTLYIAEALPEDGRVISLERSAEHHAKARELLVSSPHAAKIDLRQGDAAALLEDLQVTPDIVFIDADKPNYPRYLDWALAKVRVGGLIVGDNTFLFGHLIGEDRGERTSPTAIAAMREFNERLAQHPDYCSTIIPTYEGMTVAVRMK